MGERTRAWPPAETTVYYFKYLGPPDRVAVCTPSRHREMSVKVYRNLEVTPQFLVPVASWFLENCGFILIRPSGPVSSRGTASEALPCRRFTRPSGTPAKLLVRRNSLPSTPWLIQRTSPIHCWMDDNPWQGRQTKARPDEPDEGSVLPLCFNTCSLRISAGQKGISIASSYRIKKKYPSWSVSEGCSTWVMNKK